MLSRLFSIGLLLLVNLAYGQSIFDEHLVHEIRISTANFHLNETLDKNVLVRKARDTTIYEATRMSIDGVWLDSVGIRYKGSSSYHPEMSKKSLKLDFNIFIKGQKFQGLRKLNLHNSFADASLLRDPLAYKLFNEMGVKAPRTAFTRVYVNDDFIGLYQIVEQIDKSFSKGALFKNMGWQSLSYRGENPDNYRGKIDLKGKETSKKWRDFTSFLKFIDQSDSETFADSIAQYLDVDNFIKILVVLTATNNYDSVIKSGRNWYLNKPSDSIPYAFIPWDANLSFSAVFPSQHEKCAVDPQYLWTISDKKTIQFYDDSKYFTEISYQWNFGDGNTSNLKNPTHTYRRNGTYDVCLDISILDYCTKRICKRISTKDKDMSCINGNTNADFRKAKIIDKYPECCEEWSDSCNEKYNVTKDQELYSFSFYPENIGSHLVSKIMAIPQFHKIYTEEMCVLLNFYLTENLANEYIDKMVLLIEDDFKRDSFSLESFEEFQNVTGRNNSERNLRNIVNNRIRELKDFDYCSNK